MWSHGRTSTFSCWKMLRKFNSKMTAFQNMYPFWTNSLCRTCSKAWAVSVEILHSLFSGWLLCRKHFWYLWSHVNVTVFLSFVAPEEWATTRSSLKAPPPRSARGGYREHPYGRYWRPSSPGTSPQRQFLASGLHINSNKTSNSPFFFFSYSRDNFFMITPIYFLYFLYTVGVTLTLVLIFKTD